jgi:hypothetical protein
MTSSENYTLQLLKTISQASHFPCLIQNSKELCLFVLFQELTSLGFQPKLFNSSSSSHVITDLPETWKNNPSDMYSLELKHTQSSFLFCLKGMILGHTLILHGFVKEVDQVNSLEIDLQKLMSPTVTYPLEKNLVSLQQFQSLEILENMLKEFKEKIIQKWIPDVFKR